MGKQPRKADEMKRGNKGGRGRYRKRVLRVRNELHRHGGKNQGKRWAAKQASRIHGRRKSTGSTNYGRRSGRRGKH